MEKRKTSKNTEPAELELLSNDLLVRKSNMEVVGIYGCADKNDFRHLVIPEGVKSINDNVFARHNKIVSVSFHESRKGRVGCCRIYPCRGKRQTDSYKKIS